MVSHCDLHSHTCTEDRKTMFRFCLFLLCFVVLLSRASSTTPKLIWIGAVTPTSFILHMHLPLQTTLITLSTSATFTPSLQTLTPSSNTSITPTSIYSPLHRFSFSSLTPSTLYFLAMTTNNILTPLTSIRTYPNASSPILLTLASCQFRPSWDEAFEYMLRHAIRANNTTPPTPFAMLHMGDMAYADITIDDPAQFKAALTSVLERPRVRHFFSTVNVAYMYDDHDYGANNAAFNSPSRQAALSNFRSFVPSYPLISAQANYYAFTIAAVRIVMTDLRAMAGKETGSILGTAQREWLFTEFQGAEAYDVLVWMSSTPWISREKTGSDSWGGYAGERRVVANKLKELGVKNMIVVGGDAHMLAVDNGRNSDYADGGGAGFPVFQAAPLAGFGSTKGGKYSDGCFGYKVWKNVHYGMLNISGGCVRFEGFSGGDTEPVVSFEKCGVLGEVKGIEDGDSCRMGIFPRWIWALVGLAIVLLVLTVVSVSWFGCRRQRKMGENDQCAANETAQDGSDAGVEGLSAASDVAQLDSRDRDFRDGERGRTMRKRTSSGKLGES